MKLTLFCLLNYTGEVKGERDTGEGDEAARISRRYWREDTLPLTYRVNDIAPKQVTRSTGAHSPSLDVYWRSTERGRVATTG